MVGSPSRGVLPYLPFTRICVKSAADLALLFRVVAVAGNGNRGDGFFKLLPFCIRTLKAWRPEVFLKVRQLRCAGDGDYQ